MTTTITIKKQKFNVEEVAVQAKILASSGEIVIDNDRDVRVIQNSDDPAATERKMILAQAIYRTLKYTWGPRWDRVDENDLVGTILAANTNRVKRLRRSFK